MSMSVRTTLAIALLALAHLCGCTGERPPVTFEFTALNTPGTLQFAHTDQELAPQAFATVQTIMQDTDGLLNPHNPHSDVYKINVYAGSTRMPLAQRTYRLLLLGLEHGDKMDGAYDITSQPLRALWGFGSTALPTTPPSAQLIQATKSAVGADLLSLVDPSIAFESPEVRINMDSLSRGYAVDLSIIQLRREGYESAYIRLGNSARCLGPAGEEHPWIHRVPHPRNSDEESIGELHLPNSLAVATALLYEETVTIDGIEYGHIIDPRTGYPAEHMQSVTVVGPTATEATALAESLVVLNETAGRSLLVRYPEYEALWIPNKEPIRMMATEGFHVLFTPAPAYSNAWAQASRNVPSSALHK